MNQQNAMESEPKHECQEERNWLDLPSGVTANILNRVGIVGILESAEKVCTTWRDICKEPATWRVLHMDASSDPRNANYIQMCKHAVDRSQGQLVDLTILNFGNDEILNYIASRSCQVKRLTIRCCDDHMGYKWFESLQKFPLLEELSLYVGCNCPLLKMIIDDWMAMDIGNHLHELRHLQLIGSAIQNDKLEMILDGCHHLDSLDLRGSFFIKLDGDLGRRCLQRRIKCVKLPYDSLEGCPFISKEDVLAMWKMISR